MEGTGRVAAPQPRAEWRRPLGDCSGVLMVVDGPHSPNEVTAVHRLSPTPPGVHLMHVLPTQEGPLLPFGCQRRLKERGKESVFFFPTLSHICIHVHVHVHVLCKNSLALQVHCKCVCRFKVTLTK